MISFIRAILKYKDFVVLFFALIISLTLILSNDNSSIFHLKSRVNSFVSTIFNPFIWYDNIFSLKEDNAILKQKIAQSQAALSGGRLRGEDIMQLINDEWGVN